MSALTRYSAWLLASVALLAALGAAGCGGGAVTSDVTVSIASSNTVLSAGESAQVIAVVTWTDTGGPASGMAVSFDSSSPGSLLVQNPHVTSDAEGRAVATVQGLSEGFASVRAAVGTARSRSLLFTVR
jgi:hypothetical protein